MKAMMSVFIVMIMAFALVSSGEAGTWFSCCNDKPGAISAGHNTSGNVSSKDADRFGSFPTGTPYPCGVESPAYLDYTDARAVPCADRDRDRSGRTPEPMGSTGW